jgi:hypothetical protein
MPLRAAQSTLPAETRRTHATDALRPRRLHRSGQDHLSSLLVVVRRERLDFIESTSNAAASARDFSLRRSSLASLGRWAADVRIARLARRRTREHLSTHGIADVRVAWHYDDRHACGGPA